MKALTKAQRNELKKMFDGHCAYCGSQLGEKWHADHIEAIYRKWWSDNSPAKPENERIDNYFPACVPCNLFKTVFNLEQFRDELEKQTERAMKSSVNYRNAIRFGLIIETNKPIIFHFEQLKNNKNQFDLNQS